MHEPLRTAADRKVDFARSPSLILWELTRACGLACKHCRARALDVRDPLELSTAEASTLLDQFNDFDKPLIVLTGGDPAERPDLFEIIQEAKRKGFHIAITPSATPLVTRTTIEQLKKAGVSRLAISIDGPDETSHDSFRGVQGSFKLSKDIIRWAKNNDLPVQINSTVCRTNFDRFDQMAYMVADSGATLWSVFFLVPTGRANDEMQITAQEAELVLRKMAALSLKSSFDIKSTAAPQFRRVILESYASENQGSGENDLSAIKSQVRVGAMRSYQSVNDGKGLVFISHKGEVFPSGFLPLAAGNVRDDSVVSLYRESALFTSLRNPSNLTGKCGRCKFKAICGGSRARAYAQSGDYLAEDKLCAYQPPP